MADTVIFVHHAPSRPGEDTIFLWCSAKEGGNSVQCAAQQTELHNHHHNIFIKAQFTGIVNEFRGFSSEIR